MRIDMGVLYRSDIFTAMNYKKYIIFITPTAHSAFHCSIVVVVLHNAHFIQRFAGL
jgi:hypothetical protein